MMSSRPNPPNSSLTIKTVGPEEINIIIKNLKNSKASGLDNIDTYILKLIRPHIIAAVTHIVNTSITTLKFPSHYKNAKIVPLFKGNELPTTNSKSYRPVALLPVASKI